MEQQVDTNKLILKTKQYEFSDGLREIQSAIVFILMGIQWDLTFHPKWWSFLFMLRDNYGKWALQTAAILMLVTPVVVGWGLLPIIKRIRRRWLWQESGMVSSFLILVPKRYTVFSAIVFLSIVGLGLSYQSFLQTGEFYIWSLIMLASGWASAVSIGGLAKNIGLSRFRYMSYFVWLASPLVLFLQSSLGSIGLLFMLGWGAAFMVSGLYTFRQAWPEMKGEAYV